MFIQGSVVYCAFCLSSLDEIVSLTITKAGRALKFFFPFPFFFFFFFFLIDLYSLGLGVRNIYPISEFGVFSLYNNLFVLEITLKVLRKLWARCGYKLCRQKRKARRNNYVYILSSKLTCWPMRARVLSR